MPGREWIAPDRLPRGAKMLRKYSVTQEEHERWAAEAEADKAKAAARDAVAAWADTLPEKFLLPCGETVLRKGTEITDRYLNHLMTLTEVVAGDVAAYIDANT